MPRPSRHVDVQLLAAGRALYPEHGAGGLSVRKLAEHAGVNVGMFHYHFGSKDAFVRALLQSLYEPMFASLETAASAPSDPLDGLRASLRVIARFVALHRALLRRLLIDAVAGEAAAVDFIRVNFPRHVRIVVGLIGAGQKAGRLRPVPVAQAVTFVAGAVASPILLGSMLVDAGFAPPDVAMQFEADVFADRALDERIDMAIAGLVLPADKAR